MDLECKLPRALQYLLELANDAADGGQKAPFHNRSRQVQLGNTKPWDPGNAVRLGVQENDLMGNGRSAFDAGRFDQAFQAFQQAATAGNAEVMNFLGYLYDQGKGVTRDQLLAQQWYERGGVGCPGLLSQPQPCTFVPCFDWWAGAPKNPSLFA